MDWIINYSKIKEVQKMDYFYSPYRYDEDYHVHIYNHAHLGLRGFMLVSLYFANHKKVRYCLPIGFNLIRLYRKFANKAWFVKEVHIF